LQGHICNTKIRAASPHTELRDRIVWAPIFNANSNFGGELIWRIAEKQKIGGLDHGNLLVLVRAIYVTYGEISPIVGQEITV
jgi:hypothetical protein